jgi:hypothetical protein
MPRIDDQILDCVIYLYPSEASARVGELAGGTGFLVGVPSQHEGRVFIYAVTNSHVIREAGSPVIRFNAMHGDAAILPLVNESWYHHPDGDDIAVVHIGGLNESILKYRCIPTILFATKETIEKYDIGPGDDVFMVGRFIGHDGRQRNLPSVRFGNISMMPHENVQHPRQYGVESFLVETRSLGGYSGSPVFVHIPQGSGRPKDSGSIVLRESLGPWLLGIDWGHVPIFEKVKERDRQTDTPEGYAVQSNSGQMAVAPAWKLQEILNDPRFVNARKDEDAKIAANKPNMVVLDAAVSGFADKPTFIEALKRSDQK